MLAASAAERSRKQAPASLHAGSRGEPGRWCVPGNEVALPNEPWVREPCSNMLPASC